MHLLMVGDLLISFTGQEMETDSGPNQRQRKCMLDSNKEVYIQNRQPVQSDLTKAGQVAVQVPKTKTSKREQPLRFLPQATGPRP